MAITSKSTLRDVLADPRAVAVIEEYVPGFVEEKADLLGPVLGMKINMLLKFSKAQRPVIQCRWQTETMLDQRHLAGPVPLVHTANLRHRHMALIDDAEHVLGEVIDERKRRLTWFSAV